MGGYSLPYDKDRDVTLIPYIGLGMERLKFTDIDLRTYRDCRTTSWWRGRSKIAKLVMTLDHRVSTARAQSCAVAFYLYHEIATRREKIYQRRNQKASSYHVVEFCFAKTSASTLAVSTLSTHEKSLSHSSFLYLSYVGRLKLRFATSQSNWMSSIKASREA